MIKISRSLRLCGDLFLWLDFYKSLTCTTKAEHYPNRTSFADMSQDAELLCLSTNALVSLLLIAALDLIL